MTTRVPQYRRAAWGGHCHELDLDGWTLALFDRRTGWGWGELLGPDGQLLAVLEHLGELAVLGQDVPMRLEAAEVRVLGGVEGEPPGWELDLVSVTLADALQGSSFDTWVGAPLRGPVLTGTLQITPGTTAGSFRLTWSLTCDLDVSVRYLRGPWLRVGASSTGIRREDAVLPGVEWAVGQEWTSGQDWFRDPWAMRAVPPPDSVAIPVMAVSVGGHRISLEWEPDQEVTGWFSFPRQRWQPVFASPDFVHRASSHLMGLMLPESTTSHGDQWEATDPLPMHRGQRIAMTAQVVLGTGSGLDAVTAWVAARGLPHPPVAGFSRTEALDRIARTYAETLWHGSDGFGLGQQPGDVRRVEPRFAEEYLAGASSPEAAALRSRLSELRAAGPLPRAGTQDVVAEATGLLAHQHEDGSFRFDPDGRHRSKDDFVVARDLVEPMGVPGDSALDLTARPALMLLRAAALEPERFTGPARRALEAARAFSRPEAGDYWETPLHAPNLLAAGHGAVLHALAFQQWGEEQDRLAARHWLRSLLVFTHLWEPRGRPMLYNTKPCLASSDWYFANWVRDHVQWEVLESFALAHELGVDLAAMDEEIDWDRYQAGVTWAAVRWLLDATEDSWRPHNLPATLDLYRAGRFDGCLPDTHNSTTGLYGGMAIPPDVVAVNLLALRRPHRGRPGPRPAASTAARPRTGAGSAGSAPDPAPRPQRPGR